MMREDWRGAPIVVVGVGADGWEGLGERAKGALGECGVVVGSERQLGLVAGRIRAELVRWPSPLVPALARVIEQYRGRGLGILASGDPMFYGIGVRLARMCGAEALRVFPHVSSVSLACARLGWSLPDIGVVSVVGRALGRVVPELTDGRRLVVLCADEKTPRAIVDLLRDKGFGKSRVTMLEQLGGPAERMVTARAADWEEPLGDPLVLVAIEVASEETVPRLTRSAGVPDAAFGGTGQFTKAELRAAALAELAPLPGELLWDIGAGSGSVAIEWCRSHPSCRAVCFERVPRRRERIAELAEQLGAVEITVRGEVPASLPGEKQQPDAIFVGGAARIPGVWDTCWSRLRPGGRLVAHAVTVETEAELVNRWREHGGNLRRLQISVAETLGESTAWRPRLPVAQWSVTKPRDESKPG